MPKPISNFRVAEEVDWVVVATKAYDEPAAAAWVKVLSSSTTRVAILQNGVEHATHFPIVELERLVQRAIDGRPPLILRRLSGSHGVTGVDRSIPD